ncbi:RNA polymerase sigma factor [Peristeroidobacter soli]|uniref:RNA polymerase sigma factor n=1 Tax=Peristeroidobacter soli TaxID=2497877 RepID=UPI0013009CC2|nr:RNA polymerase sigma factor [Peristeroidobacter soli]
MSSFDSFFRAHGRDLTAYLRRRTATEADAQEILQESYARILGYGYGDSRPPEVWKSLLYRIATNLAISQQRMNRVRNVSAQCPLDEVELPSDTPSQERQIAAEQELALIRAAIEALTPKCRKVFLLSRVHQRTYPEIARLCGISVKMVEKYMSQALASMRGAIGSWP